MIVFSSAKSVSITTLHSFLSESGDYWKLTAEGELIFDGRKGVYDENDELLREFEGEGGYAASLPSTSLPGGFTQTVSTMGPLVKARWRGT